MLDFNLIETLEENIACFIQRKKIFRGSSVIAGLARLAVKPPNSPRKVSFLFVIKQHTTILATLHFIVNFLKVTCTIFKIRIVIMTVKIAFK